MSVLDKYLSKTDLRVRPLSLHSVPYTEDPDDIEDISDVTTSDIQMDPVYKVDTENGKAYIAGYIDESSRTYVKRYKLAVPS